MFCVCVCDEAWRGACGLKEFARVSTASIKPAVIRP